MKMSRTLVLLAVLLTACTRAGTPEQQASPPPELPVAATPAGAQTGPRDQALSLIARGDFQGAERLLKEAVINTPADADSWNDLSLVQANLAKWPEAVQSARKALALQPEMLFAKYNLGWALLHTPEWATAWSPLEEAVRGGPDRPEPLVALGQWYRMGADLNKAELLYARAVALGHDPARKLLADMQAEAAAPWEAVSAGTPNGVPVPADALSSQKSGKRLVSKVDLGNGDSAELYADPTQIDLLVSLSNGLGYALRRSPAGEPAPPTLTTISTPYGAHLLITGEDGRMTQGWVLIPQTQQITNALHARMDFGITVQGDALKLSYRKYREGGGYAVQASLWRYDPKSGRYEISHPVPPGTQVITSSGLCNHFPAYLPLTLSQGRRSPDGFLAYDGAIGRWGRVQVIGGPYATVRGVRVGDPAQRVTERYGPSGDGFYQDEPPSGYTRFTFKEGTVESFTVSCDNTTRGPLGK